jgi:hypothetical protein
LFFFDVEEVCWNDVEVFGVELDKAFEVRGAYTVMTKLVMY